jgi:hypothetical protein
MRVRTMQSFAAVAVLLLAIPVFAAKDAGVNKADFEIHDSITVGQTQLKPGQYSLQAVNGQNELSIVQNGKVIAKAPCHWIQLPAKASASQVESSEGKVTQVSFRGNLQAVQLD